MRSLRVALVILVACSIASLSARRDLVANAKPSFALDVIADDLDVIVENGAGALDALIRIENVSNVERVLPILCDAWVGRIDVVDSGSGRSVISSGSCSGGRDPNVGHLLKPGESVQHRWRLPVGTLFQERDRIFVQVRYRCEDIERVTIIDPSDVGTAPRSTRALELVSKSIAIRRISARSRESK